MNRILIYDYSPEHTLHFSGERLIPRVTRVEDIRPSFDEASSNNQVFTVWFDNPLLSLSDIRLDESFEGIPIVMHLYNLGDLFTVMSSLDIFKRLSARVFVSSSLRENFTSLKILSSLGIDCGLLLDSAKIDDDAFVDLGSYFFLSQIPHASIEPFDFIWRNLQNEKNLDFSTVFFYNPEKYVYVNAEGNMAFSSRDLFNNSYIGKYDPRKDIDFETGYKEKAARYYEHFMTLDSCSKCPSFHICNRELSKRFKNCTETFNSIFEYAEILDGIERKRNNTKELCQL